MRIRLERPNIPFLCRDFSCFDMHVHSKYSDSFTRPLTLVHRAEKLGIGFSLTDHNEVRGVKDVLKMKPSCRVIPGIEVGCAEGPHILAYFHRYSDLEHFFERHVLPFRHKNPYRNTDLPIQDLIDASSAYPCFLAAAHPEVPPDYGLSLVAHKGIIPKDLVSKIPVFEVINGFATEKMNLHAIKSAFEYGRGFIGGSDSHVPKHFGSVVTCVSGDDLDSVFGDILGHKSIVVGKNMRIHDRFNPGARSITKHMRFRGTLRSRARSVLSRPLKSGFDKLRRS